MDEASLWEQNAEGVDVETVGRFLISEQCDFFGVGFAAAHYPLHDPLAHHVAELPIWNRLAIALAFVDALGLQPHEVVVDT